MHKNERKLISLSAAMWRRIFLMLLYCGVAADAAGAAEKTLHIRCRLNFIYLSFFLQFFRCSVRSFVRSFAFGYAIVYTR